MIMMSSEIASYSPISSLERQYASVISSSPSAPPPQRVLLFASLNANCCLAAGVETILQAQHNQNKRGGSVTTASLGSPMAGGSNEVTSADASSSEDPFSFLQDNDTARRLSASNSSNTRNTSTTISSTFSTNPKLAAPLNFFKKVAQHTTQTLERGVQGLAIRADKGKSPDVLVVGLYDSATDRLISCTESQPVPYREEERLAGMVFHIPMWMHLQVGTATTASPSVTLKVWIQSGATLLGTKVAKHHYLLGQVTFSVLVPSSSSTSPFAPPISYLLQSNHVVNGQVSLLVSRDLKWPIPHTPGWSLVHPNYQSYALYHPPLDQSYAYREVAAMTTTKTTSSSPSAATAAATITTSMPWCIATERAIESTVIVPIATAVMELAHQASLQSLQHATAVIQQTMAVARHDQPPTSATVTQKAIGQLHIYHHLQIMTNSTSSSTTNTTSSSTTTSGPLPPPPPSLNTTFGRSNSSGLSSSSSVAYYLRVSWQRPDSIFEMELLPLTAISTSTNSNNVHANMIALPFYPKLCWTLPSTSPSSSTTTSSSSSFVPGVLELWGQQPLPPFLLGSLRLEVIVSRGSSSASGMGNPFDPIGTTAMAAVPSPNDEREVWQNIVALESYISTTSTTPVANNSAPSTPPLVVRLFHAKTGQVMGSINLHLVVHVPPPTTTTPPQPPNVNHVSSAKGGLVSFMGLDNLSEELNGTSKWKSPQPVVDYVEDNDMMDPQSQQFATMGFFLTPTYLQQHVTQIRTLDVQRFQQVAQSYRAALSTHKNNNHTSSLLVPAHMDQSPKPFRPSSSRTEDLLSAIPFNVHIQAVDVIKIPAAVAPPGVTPTGGAMFHNVTCGAPADHARGFGNVFNKSSGGGMYNTAAASLTSPIGTVAGGLRRLEAKRLELAQLVQRAQSALAIGVASYQSSCRRQQQQLQASSAEPPIYIPARHFELTNLRLKVFEALQALHHVTWLCAVRRANCFSQALGVALSSYLTSISNCTSGWPEAWVRHGYLITFEGLLSAAGKELGMIEDAAVAIAMLRQVSVVIVAVEDPGAWRQQQQQQVRPGLVEIPESPHLVYVNLTATTSTARQYRVEIGMDANNYRQHIPEALKHGTPVSFYPLLFQVGVDIRQWGANAGNQVKNQLTGSDIGGSAPTSSVFDDDADDDAGVVDDDVLVQLNYEALRKLNGYVHALYPLMATTAPSTAAPMADLLDAATPQVPQQVPQQLQIHPSLAMLHSHILSSAGRMNHNILDEAATIGQQLGGGGVVFCKSGKDRTAMQVTYKQAQFVNRVLKTPPPQPSAAASDVLLADGTLQDATLMRIYGTRLLICEKNVGQAKYAFNSLQVQFMPDALKPPPSTLAGFLKGGRIFGKGGIES